MCFFGVFEVTCLKDDSLCRNVLFSFLNQNNDLIHNNKMQQQEHQELVTGLWSLCVLLHTGKDNVRNHTSDPSKAKILTEEWHIARDQSRRGGKGACVRCKS